MKFAPDADFRGAGDAGMNAKVEEGAGSATPPSLSTQIPHEPSAQSSKSADACASPRCLRHPGHAQSVPQQHSGAAWAVMALSGGMGGNAGGAELLEDAWRSGVYSDGLGKRGGRAWSCEVDEVWAWDVCLDRFAFGLGGRDDGWLEQHPRERF